MATLTITTTAPQDARIVAAYGRRLSLPGNASAAQVKAAVIEQIKQVVRDYEANQAIQSAINGIEVLEIT